MSTQPNCGDCALITDPGQHLFTRARSVVSRIAGGKTLIVPVRAKVGDLASIYSFSGAGSLIWQLLEAPRTLPELVSAVEREYNLGTDEAHRDVTRFVHEMFSVGLVEVCPRVAITATEATPHALWETADTR